MVWSIKRYIMKWSRQWVNEKKRKEKKEMKGKLIGCVLCI